MSLRFEPLFGVEESYFVLETPGSWERQQKAVGSLWYTERGEWKEKKGELWPMEWEPVRLSVIEGNPSALSTAPCKLAISRDRSVNIATFGTLESKNLFEGFSHHSAGLSVISDAGMSPDGKTMFYMDGFSPTLSNLEKTELIHKGRPDFFRGVTPLFLSNRLLALQSYGATPCYDLQDFNGFVFYAFSIVADKVIPLGTSPDGGASHIVFNLIDDNNRDEENWNSKLLQHDLVIAKLPKLPMKGTFTHDFTYVPEGRNFEHPELFRVEENKWVLMATGKGFGGNKTVVRHS